MASFSINITDITFAGGRTGYKRVTVSNIPSAGLTLVMSRSGDNSYFRVSTVGTGVYQIETKVTNNTGSTKSTYIRFTNNDDATDYVQVDIRQLSVTSMNLYGDGTTITQTGTDTYSIDVDPDTTGSYNFNADVAGGYEVYGDVLSGSDWIDVYRRGVSDTGFWQFWIVCSTNFDEARSGNVRIYAQGLVYTNTLTVVQAAGEPTEELSVSPSSLSYDASGGSRSIAFTYRGSTYSYDDTAVSSWIDVSLHSIMTGVMTGTVTCASNPNTSYRSGDIIFSDTSGSIALPIYQDGRDVTLAVSPSSLSFSSSQETKQVAVSFQGVLTTNATSMPSWLSESYVTVDSTHRTYNITAAQNNTSSSRFFDFELEDDNSAVTVPITQEAGSAPVQGLSIYPESMLVGSSGDYIDVHIFNSIDINSISYIISNNFLTYAGKETDQLTGYPIFHFNCSANTSSSGRTATVTFSAPGFASSIFSLTQEGTIQTELMLSPSSANVNYKSGTTVVEISPSNVEDVSYVISGDWIHYVSQGSYGYRFGYDMNYSTFGRTGTVTFSAPGYDPVVFTLVQAGRYEEIVQFTPNILEFNYLGGSEYNSFIRIRRNAYSGTLYGRISGNIPIEATYGESGYSLTNIPSSISRVYYKLANNSVNDTYTDIDGKIEYYDSETGGNKVGEIILKWKGTPRTLTVTPNIAAFYTNGTLGLIRTKVFVSAVGDVDFTYPDGSGGPIRVTLLEEHNTYKVYGVRTEYEDCFVTFSTGDGNKVLLNSYNYVVHNNARSIAVGPRRLSLPLSGEPIYLVTSGSLNISSMPDWLNIESYYYTSITLSGYLKYNIYRLSAQATASDRTGNIYFGGSSVIFVPVYQEAGALYASPNEMTFSSNGGSDNLTVTYTGSLTVDGPLPGWLSVTETSSSPNTKTYSVNVLRNTGDFRSWNLIFTDDNGNFVVPITQEVGAPSIVVVPQTNVVGESAGTISVSVFGPEGMQYNIIGDWVTLVSYSGSTYTFAYEDNISGQGRTATVVFSASGYLSATYRLTQAAGESLKATPSKLRFHKYADTKKISFSNITSNIVDYEVTYIDDSGWLSISGVGLLKEVSVSDNSGSRRRASVKFFDRNNIANFVIVDVIQGGDGYDSIWMDTLYYPENRYSDGSYYYRLVDSDSSKEYFRGISVVPEGWTGDVGGIDIPRLVDSDIHSEFTGSGSLLQWTDMSGYCTVSLYDMTSTGYPGVLEKTFKYWNDWSNYQEIYDYTVCLNDPINSKGCDNMIIPVCVYYDEEETLTVIEKNITGSTSSYTLPAPNDPFVMTYGSFNNTDTVEFMIDNDVCFSYDMTHCGPGAFIYRNRFGGWDSFLVEGNISKKDTYNKQNYRKKGEYNSSYSINTLHYFDEKYTDSNDITTSYEAHTGWLTDEESERLAYHLLSSPIVYFQNFDGGLYDSDPFTLIPVRLTASSTEYKKFRNGKKLVSYTITFEKSNIQKVGR